MRSRLPVALGGIVVTAAALALWRRRRPMPDVVRLGLADGHAIALGASDPAKPELAQLAATLRHHLEIGG